MMTAWIIETTLTAGFLTLFAAGVSRRWHLHPGLCHVAWLLVLLRLLVPPGVIAWPWSVTAQWPARVTELENCPGVSEAHPSSNVAPDESEGLAIQIDSPLPDPGDVSSSTATLNTPTTSSDLLPTLERLLTSLWFGGSLLVLGRRLREAWSIRQLVRLTHSADTDFRRVVVRWARRLDLRPPELRIVPGLKSPVVVGLWRPILLWPTELQAKVNDDGYQAALIHELAHLRRGDHWVRWIEILAGVLWWWNPLFHLARHRLRRYSELACDSWVLSVLPQSRRSYASTLLRFCQALSRHAEAVPALGVGGSRDDLKERLSLIMSPVAPPRSPRSVWVVGISLALISVPSWSTLGGATTTSSRSFPTNSDFVLSPEAKQILEDLLRSPDAPKNADLFRGHPTRHATNSLTAIPWTDVSDGITTESYRMPPDLAQALVRLFRALVAPERLQAVAKEGQLLVTTRSADQPTVARFIRSFTLSNRMENSR